MKGGSETAAGRFAPRLACGAPPGRLAKVGEGRRRSSKVGEGRRRSSKVGDIPPTFRSSLPHGFAMTSGALHFVYILPSQLLPTPPNASQLLPTPPNASQCQPACRPHCKAGCYGPAAVSRGTFTFVKCFVYICNGCLCNYLQV